MEIIKEGMEIIKEGMGLLKEVMGVIQTVLVVCFTAHGIISSVVSSFYIHIIQYKSCNK